VGPACPEDAASVEAGSTLVALESPISADTVKGIERRRENSHNTANARAIN